MIIGVAQLLGLAMMACSPSAPDASGPTEAEAFARQIDQSIEQISRAHDVLRSPEVYTLPAAEQDERYRSMQAEITDELVSVQSLNVPESLRQSQQELSEVLLMEQQIWKRMSLYAISGDEAQRAKAELEAWEIEVEARRVAADLSPVITGKALGLSAPEQATQSVEASDEAVVPVTPAYPSLSEDAIDTPGVVLPNLSMSGATGDIIILRYRDREKQPAMVAHWSMDVRPGELALVDYPFVGGDKLEMSLFGNRLDLAYMEAPSGKRILELEDILRPWRGDVAAEEDGWYRIYLDNTQGDSIKNMHVIVTYHDEAPDAVHLSEEQDEAKIILPLDRVSP